MLDEVRAATCGRPWPRAGRDLHLFKHVLKNAMIPILTTTVLSIPFLSRGASFWRCISAYRAWVISAQRDRRSPISPSSGPSSMLLPSLHSRSILTDISYTLVDPRVTLE